MGEETVVADRQAKPGEQPHAEKQAELNGANRPVKQQAQRDQRPDKGQHVENDEVPALYFMKVTAFDDPMVAHFFAQATIQEGNNVISVHSPAWGCNPSP